MPRTSNPSGLTTLQERFVAEYLVDCKPTQAAIRAGYSERSAQSTAKELMANPKVRAAINAGKRRIAKKLDLTAEKVLADIERISNKAEKSRQFNAAIRGKQLLGQHLKLFTEKHEHGGIGGGPVVMQVTSTDEAL